MLSEKDQLFLPETDGVVLEELDAQ